MSNYINGWIMECEENNEEIRGGREKKWRHRRQRIVDFLSTNRMNRMDEIEWQGESQRWLEEVSDQSLLIFFTLSPFISCLMMKKALLSSSLCLNGRM